MRNLLLGLLLLAGCPKSSSDPAAGETGPPPPPEGFTRLPAPEGYDRLRPLTSAVLPDGSVVIAGSAIRAVQYQWTLRAPATGEPGQMLYDPGRIEWVSHNGTAGLDAAGVLGGVPQDSAWYGEIDAFGKVGTRQTYLSDGAGQLQSVARLGDGLAFGGQVVDQEGAVRGWVVRTDLNGREQWTAAIGEAPAQGLEWLADQGGILVGAGWQLDTSEDPWVVALDGSGAPVLDKRWEDTGWTRLSSGRVLPSGDLLVAGLSAPSQEGALDGAGSLWLGRVGADGAERWDRTERSDLSAITRGAPWGSGMAFAALRGPYGTARDVLVAVVDDDGDTTWTEVDLPAGIDFAEVHVVNEQLWLVAAVLDEVGISYRKKLLEGGAAP